LLRAGKQPTRVSEIRRAIEHIPVEVGIPRGEPDWVLAEEPPNPSIVISCAVVILPGFPIPLAAGVAEAEGDTRITLAGDVAVAVVANLVEEGAGGVGNLADAALVVGEYPPGLASRLFGEDLVYRGAMEVTLGEGVVTAKN
jgi:hypothetical protein